MFYFLQLVHLDMSPNFAGTMLGITNCVANLTSIIAPLAAGAIIKDEVRDCTNLKTSVAHGPVI